MKQSIAIIVFLAYAVMSTAQDPGSFIFVWQTSNISSGSSDEFSASIPTHASHTYNYDVDWDGDGVFDSIGMTGTVTHQYKISGKYRIAIKGQFPRIHFNNGGDRLKILDIEQWGNLQWENMNSAFDGCANLIESAEDAPDLSMVASMSEMFRRATNFTGDLSNWNVSQVPWMIATFQNASKFNGDISMWKIKNVNSIRYMFDGATAFNQDISNWNLSNVTTLQYTFRNATAFDQNLGNWDMDAVDNVTGMLDNCGMSRLNYDLTLTGWADQSVLPNLTLGANGLQYCNGIYARSELMVEANMGIMCMPKWALKSFRLSKDLIFKRIGRSGFKRTHHLVFRKSDKPKKYINDFILNFEDEFSKV